MVGVFFSRVDARVEVLQSYVANPRTSQVNGREEAQTGVKETASQSLA